MDQPSSWGQPSSWPPHLAPPALPSQVRQGSSLHVKVHHDLDQGVSEPQAGLQTPAQQLVAGLDPAKIQAVAASQVVMSERSYTIVLQHAQRLFRWALVAAGAGVIFFVVAVALLLVQPSVNGAVISLTSGVTLEALAVLNFCLYGRVLNHCRAFDERLDRTQQYLLANSLCENLKGDVKQATQIELIRAMMHAVGRQEDKRLTQ
jgi:hypothetical protein